MKRGKKLIALLAALLVLMGGTYVLQQINFEGEEPQETEAAEAEVIFAATEEEITKIAWTLGEVTLTFEQTEDGWVYPEDEHFPVDNDMMGNVLAKVESLTTTKTIKGVTDLAEYGLDEPAVKINVTTDESCEILIGDKSTLGGYYASLGDGNVYLIAEAVKNMFSKELYDLVLEEEIPDLTTLEALEAVSGIQNLSIVYREESGLAYSDSYVWFWENGDEALALDNELFAEWVKTITGISWDECVDYYADSEELKTYGLDAPTVTLTVSYIETTQMDTETKDDDGKVIYETKEETKTFQLELGAYSDDSCYARIADSRMVYLVDAEICDVLMYAGYDALRPDDVLLMTWDDVTAIDVVLDGTTYEVIREEIEGTDDDGNKTVSYVYKLDGEEIEILDVLDMLVAMESTGSKDGIVPERAQEIKFILYRDNDKYPLTELEFYQYDSSSCLVSLNDESRLFVSRDDVTAVAEAFTKMMLGDDSESTAAE